MNLQGSSLFILQRASSWMVIQPILLLPGVTAETCITGLDVELFVALGSSLDTWTAGAGITQTKWIQMNLSQFVWVLSLGTLKSRSTVSLCLIYPDAASWLFLVDLSYDCSLSSHLIPGDGAVELPEHIWASLSLPAEKHSLYLTFWMTLNTFKLAPVHDSWHEGAETDMHNLQ